MKNNNISLSYKVIDIARTIFVYLLAAIIIFAAIIFAVDKSPQKSIFGYRYYTVLTPSMTPAYKVGDLVIVKISGPENIEVGDAITFNPSADSNAYLTHRVTTKIENYEGSGITCFKTKGDANESEDGFLLDQSRVIGKVVFSFPKVGYAIRFVQLKWYFVIPLVILFFVFLKLLDMYVDSGEEKDKETKGEKVSS